MVMFLSPKSFLLQISLRRNRLKRSSASFRSASLHSGSRKAASSFSGAYSSKRRRREHKKFLPEEVIGEILLRLPVKSLLRFRCVSKSWHSLISSPLFAELHFQRSPGRTHRILVTADSQFQSIDFNAPFHDDSAVVHLNFPRRRTPDDLEIMGSCRGFLLLVVDKQQKLFIWNPSNGVCRKIPPLNRNIFVYMYGFAYDESTDDYILVLVSDFLAFFSLKTKSWEILADECQYIYQWDEPTSGSILNGAIHWFAKRVRQPPPECFTIIAFDIAAKNLREIPVPDDYEVGSGFLGVVGGCLTLTENSDVIKMWVMKEYGVKSSWTRLFTVSTNPCHIEFFQPLCFTKDNQLVVRNSTIGLLKLSAKEELQVVDYLKFFRSPMSFACASVYTETLLSLPSV
ncbi:F-box/kelch-repeat protein At3g06240-like [Prosopis cineraria]|uniref:F-box/kelch-repeat protein At3g06240-like n=1 Tax=Prosopis cineraria TaxID=364024 RepID=UPI00240FBCD6|nr:F-box/kelch-repeat protein At3g06240-like [Prosopis cineraria]XP_054786086.1 F-box/kelch-repeat protein At3g06240-like [Prosopis cineraria]XP_054786087.1 F-box/kelch-repeat protein At3g06240-like [Prosopis cineraria]XP_054786088.1 F-box/kelch-repeat protein At3g06240-like [Prosopis cineraria]